VRKCVAHVGKCVARVGKCVAQWVSVWLMWLCVWLKWVSVWLKWVSLWLKWASVWLKWVCVWHKGGSVWLMCCWLVGYGCIQTSGLYCHRERNDGLYRPITYLVSKLTEELVIAVINSVVLGALVFFPCALGGSFLHFWLVYLCTTSIGISEIPHPPPIGISEIPHPLPIGISEIPHPPPIRRLLGLLMRVGVNGSRAC
jgi:hypothetical protein